MELTLDSKDNRVMKVMKKMFMKKFNDHTNLVKEYGNKILNMNLLSSVDLNKKFKKRLDEHDRSKLSEPELTPYVIATFRYKVEDKKIKCILSEELRLALLSAQEHHFKHNRHHAEYWTDQKEIISKTDKDDPAPNIIDGSKMDKISLLEMCCDWCAVSKREGNTPMQWGKDNIGSRYYFTDDQTKIIYGILKLIW